MSNIDNIIVKNFENDPVSINSIKDLWEVSFNKKFNEKRWNWFFKRNPFTDKTYIYYIKIDNKLASYAAIQPTEILLPNNEIYLSGNTNMWMTRPGFQKNSLIRKILVKLFKELEKDGYHFIYSFPTREVSWNIMKKYLNWYDINDLMVLKINSLNSSDSCYNTIITNNVVSNEIIEECFNLSKNQEYIQILRTKEYLKWRFLEDPTNEYYYIKSIYKDFTTILIYKHYNSECDIMDVYSNCTTNENDICKYKAIQNLSRINNNSFCNIWTFKNSNFYNYCMKKNIAESKLITHFGVFPINSEINPQFLTNWSLSFMDSDVY